MKTVLLKFLKIVFFIEERAIEDRRRHGSSPADDKNAEVCFRGAGEQTQDNRYPRWAGNWKCKLRYCVVQMHLELYIIYILSIIHYMLYIYICIYIALQF